MEIYDIVSQQASRQLTLRYSTSFGMASRLFDGVVRRHIYNLYGLVRLADEVIDTFQASENGDTKTAGRLLAELEAETYAAIERRYSPNLIVHAFQITANEYAIGRQLIEPFFESMRMDLSAKHYDQKRYEKYIYGSAEVVGLMCLKVFVAGDEAAYAAQAHGAQRLGAAYQKVNFLRDIAADRQELGRSYFPGLGSDDVLTEIAKRTIIKDIEADFVIAMPYVIKLPYEARAAVKLSMNYYQALLGRLKTTPADVIATRRVRLPNSHKLYIAAKSLARSR